MICAASAASCVVVVYSILRASYIFFAGSSSFCYCFCFFKQKTAYEMRISDWSSDVCSSDLDKNRLLVTVYHNDDEAYGIWHEQVGVPADRIEIGRASCRERVCQYV